MATKFRPAPADADRAQGAVRMLRLDADDAGQRLDNFLSRLYRDVPRSHLYRLIRSGQLRVNGRRRAVDYRLQAGDTIRLPPLREPAAPGAVPPGVAGAAPGDVPRPAPGGSARATGGEAVRRDRARLGARLPVLYEDEQLLAIDKPASVAVHGGSGVSSGVIERLRAARAQARFLELVHRLDRETSGVLLLARKRAALVAMHEQLRRRDADKRYLAVVAGRWPLRTRTLAWPLARHAAPDGDRRVSVQAGGQEALTRVTGLAHVELPGLGVLSLVQAAPETGRTHQIRVHLAHAGFPIVGDPKYGDFELNREMARRGWRRMYLHAHSIAFDHPEDGRRLCIEAPMPAEFEALMRAGDAAPAQRMPGRDALAQPGPKRHLPEQQP